MDFFAQPQTASVLKHGLIESYAVPFASKVGKYSPTGRVLLADLYAGRGEYKEGTPGSPLLLARAASSVAAYRNLRIVFVEKDPEHHRHLRDCLQREGAELDWHTHLGTAGEHLDAILAAHPLDPALFFLDPFGLGLPFDVVTRKILSRPKPLGYGPGPKTEILLNFSMVGVRRVAGLLTSPKPQPHDDKRLASLDAFLGGAWWRGMHLDGGSAREIAHRYCRNIEDAMGVPWSASVVEVADVIGHEPEYLLVHVTRHPDGRWLFAEATSHATRKWREACHAEEPDKQRGQLGLFEEPPPFEEDEGAWITEITANLTRLLAEGRAVSASDHMRQIYGASLGMARGKHIKKAVQGLFDAGVTSTNPKGMEPQKLVLVPGDVAVFPKPVRKSQAAEPVLPSAEVNRLG